MFSQLDYTGWLQEHRLDDLYGVDVAAYGAIDAHQSKPTYLAVDAANEVPLAPELDDLVRLHYLAVTRRVTTVLEFGVGQSTLAFGDAVAKNSVAHGDFVSANLRRGNAFEVHSVDTSAEWITTCRERLPSDLRSFVTLHQSDASMTTFGGRACTMYDEIPNLCPDLIYIDAPDQYSVRGSVHGLSTAHVDRVPMAADLLLMEPFLLPGTLVVIDGRSANARFLVNNLQRRWQYEDYRDGEFHTLELVEAPLGAINERQLRYCLGDDWPGLRL